MILRVLAISPRFAPTNGADTHRLRLLLKHAQTSGWQVEVLAVDAKDVVGPVDPWLEETLPDEVKVHRVRALSFKGWGLNGLAQRSIWPLYCKGSELLATRRFDLVFFSTTEFALHLLGPIWKFKHGVPFCMDYQDPWVNDYYRNHPEVVPPGGRFKFAIADRIHRTMERHVVRQCSGFMAVSEPYLADLNRRYGTYAVNKPTLIKSFPAEPAELDMLNAHVLQPASQVTQPKVWRYIGRGGPDMTKAASAFFLAWQSAISDGKFAIDDAVFEADGTSYAASGCGEKTFEPLVKGTILSQKVRENADRLGYSEMLRSLMLSDALMVFGSDDPAYTASKIYPYLLAGKPLLAIFHENSSVVRLMREAGGGVCVTFNERTTQPELASAITEAWFEHDLHLERTPLNHDAFAPYTAHAQAKAVGEWFCRVRARSETIQSFQ